MPRVIIPVVNLSRSKQLLGALGTEVAGDATNDHYFINDGRTFLIARNSGVTTRTLEAVIAQTVDGVTPAVKSYSILSGEHAVLGPFPPSVYNDASGFCNVNIDHAEIKFQAWSLPTT